jgi:hypothetical protein
MRLPDLHAIPAVLCPRLGCGVLRVLYFLFLLNLLYLPASFADTARVSGTIFTVDPDRIQTLWPNARVTLKNLASGRELSTTSNELGQYSFVGIRPGEYELAVSLAGFQTATRKITLTADAPSTVDFQLVPRKQSESITVGANPAGIDTTSSSGGGQILTTTTLKSLVRLNDDFQEALPLLPGVLRGPDGLIRIKGGNANQTSALINNASIGDPFTGQRFVFLLPPWIPCECSQIPSSQNSAASLAP